MNNLLHLMSQESSDCIYLITEPYLNKGHVKGVPSNYKVYGTQNCRAIIIAPKNLPLFYSHELSNKDCCVCIYDDGKKQKCFSSIYLDGTYKDSVDRNLITLCDYITDTKVDGILAFDSNSHSVLWGSSDTDERGEQIEMLCAQYNLEILNSGNVPTFMNSRGHNSIIDITLVAGQDHGCSSWRVLDKQYFFSDHRCIEYRINLDETQKCKVRKTDWVKFNSLLPTEEVRYHAWSAHTIELEARLIHKAITTALSSSTYTAPLKVRSARFWTNELHKQKMNVKKLEAKWQSNKTTENRLLFITEKKAFQKAVRKAKRVSWKTFTDSISNPKEMAHLYRCLKGKTNESIGLLKKSGSNEYTRNTNETIDCLMNEHFSGNVPLGNNFPRDDSMPEIGNTCSEGTLTGSFITLDKVKKAISSFGADKCAGVDSVKPRIFQCLNEPMLKRLTKLYQAIVELGYTPKFWGYSKIIFISKPDKQSYADSRAFRPLSMLSQYLKNLEKLILWEMNETTLKDSPISERQFAFKKQTSVENAISDFSDEIESCILRRKYLVAASLDIKGCFDNVKTDSALSAMRRKGISAKIVSWYENILKNRVTMIDLNGHKKVFKLNKGLPQGSCLSPKIWSILMDELLRQFDNSAVTATAFADDLLVYCKGISANTCAEVLQQGIKKALLWGAQNSLTFVPEKTKTIFFHRFRKVEEPIKLKIGNQEIDYSQKFKYLGIWFDQSLNLNYEIQQRIIKAKKQVMMVRNAVGKMWGPSPKALRWGYRGIVLPSLCYGSYITARKCLNNASIRTKLSKLNRLMAITMMPTRKNTPTAGLEVILDLMPLELKLEEHALKAFLRIIPKSRYKWDGIPLVGSECGHLKWGKDKLHDLGFTDFSFDDASELNLDSKYEVDLDSFKSGLPDSNSNTLCYTDGSKMGDDTGYGFGITQGETLLHSDNGKLQNYNTVFQSEVFAIHKCCEVLLEMDMNDVTIFSDSQAALKALVSLEVKSKAVKNCIDILNRVGDFCSVQLKWVKAHVGHTGNELADQLAKSGTTNVQNRVEAPPPKSWAKGKITTAAYKAWNLRWANTLGCRQTKIWFPKLNRNKSNFILSQSRLQLGLLVQMITGHNRLNYHESKISGIDPTCRLCLEEDETSFHIVGECPALLSKRIEAFQSRFLENPPEWKVSQLKKFLNKAGVDELNRGITE